MRSENTGFNETCLWQEFKGGDIAAWCRLYEMFVMNLHEYGIRFTNDNALVEDAIQDLFYTLWISRSRLSDPPSVKNYLYKSLRTGLYKKLDQKNILLEEEQADSICFDRAIIEALTEQEQRTLVNQRIKQAMEKLTTRQRTIIYYRFYKNLQFEEIANKMNMQVRATYKLTARALESLRAYYQNKTGQY